MDVEFFFFFGSIGVGECMWYVVSPFSLQSNTICGGGVGFVRTARRVGQNKSQSKYPKLKFRPLSARIRDFTSAGPGSLLRAFRAFCGSRVMSAGQLINASPPGDSEIVLDRIALDWIVFSFFQFIFSPSEWNEVRWFVSRSSRSDSSPFDPIRFGSICL